MKYFLLILNIISSIWYAVYVRDYFYLSFVAKELGKEGITRTYYMFGFVGILAIIASIAGAIFLLESANYSFSFSFSVASGYLIIFITSLTRRYLEGYEILFLFSIAPILTALAAIGYYRAETKG